MEIAVQFLEPGANVEPVSAAGELATPTPTPTPSARPQATVSAPDADDSSSLVGWLIVLGCVVGGIVVGLIAASVLGRRAAT